MLYDVREPFFAVRLVDVDAVAGVALLGQIAVKIREHLVGVQVVDLLFLRDLKEL